MADQSFELDVLRDLLDEAGAVGQLAKGEKSFTNAYEAFRAGDRKAFQTVLKRLRLVPRCQLVCEWIRIKECVFVCLELCGPPPKVVERPDPRLLAQAIVKITSDEKLVTQLAEAIEKRDRAAFQRLVKANKLGPISHFFCHWACYLHFRLLCRWLCELELETRPSLVTELQAAGEGLRLLLEQREAFDQALAASEAGDAEKLQSTIETAGLVPFCRYICFFFCSWRCVQVCLTLCREFPLKPIEQPLKEALAFARQAAQLASNPAQLQRLSAAVGSADAKAFAAIVAELKLERFCIQLCHWICFLRCRRFCIRICIEDTIPLFTHVGAYHVDPIYGDFQPDGTTTAGGYAFTRKIPLIGILPGWEAVNTYEYRFRIAKYPTLAPVQDVVGSMIKPTVIGELEFRYWNAGWTTGSTEYYVNNPGATYPIPQKPPNLPLVVSVNTDVQAGGWIKVPHENNLTNGGGGRFIPNTGRLADLDTTQFTNESFDLTTPAPGLKAGNAIPAGTPPHSEKPVYKIFFEARKVMGPLVSSNNRDEIAFSNTAYKYVRHAEWDGGPVTTRSVCSLDIAEMIAPGASGCDKQKAHVHALYSCYHPYLGSVLLWLQGPGIPTGVGIPPSPVPPAPYSFAPAIAIDEAASGPVGHDFDITALKPCAYILWCSATVKLTEGWGLIPDATEWDVMAFCSGG
jgi:hypothetical protein